MIEKEIWKDIPGYEGYYQASNLGRVRSLDRTVTFSNGYDRFYKGRIIKGNINEGGYRQTALGVNGIGRNFKFSQIIAMTFLGHEPNGHDLVVDHINGDKSDDRVENLRIVSHRANLSTCFRSDRETLSSKYLGICFHNRDKKWQAQITINGKQKYLGSFKTEIEAHNAYQKALKQKQDGSTL